MADVDHFRLSVDDAAKVVTIQGVRYAFELFNHLGFSSVGTVLRIDGRADGVVTLTKIEAPHVD